MNDQIGFSFRGRNPDVLTCIANLSNDEVFTPPEFANRMLDVAGHRAGRKAELVELARVAVERVKETGEAEEVEPMSAFERKVVHDEVLAAGLASESEGVEPRRYVVVLPAKNV